MRVVHRALAFFFASLFASAPSSAAVLPFTGSLSIDVAVPPGANPLPLVTVPGTGVATTNGLGSHLATLALPASPFATAGLVVPVTDPAAAPGFLGFILTVHNGAGTIMGGSGPMPLAGLLRDCLFSPCKSGPPANILVPLSPVGVGGSAAASAVVNVTVSGAPWTVGTAAVGTATRMGFQHGPASLTSSTAAASGQVRLVTPIFISTNIPAEPVIAAFGILDLHFVPEPTTVRGSGWLQVDCQRRQRDRDWRSLDGR